MEHIIKYYPVGNADCTLIKLDNGKSIIVDCQILTNLTDGHGKQVMFDVKADLLKELKKDGMLLKKIPKKEKRMDLDVLLLTYLSALTLTMIIAKDLQETFIMVM